jgi:Tfp pilus assembly protein PilW
MTSRTRDDAGTTLAELLISTMLALIVTGLVTDGLISMWRAQRSTADDGDARTAAVRAGELLARDLRSGEAVTTAQSSAVTVWDDANFDYARQANELQAWTYDTTKKALCRSAAGATHCFGGPWINGVAFTYGKSADGLRVTTVGVAISYVTKPTTRTEQWSVTLPAVAP